MKRYTPRIQILIQVLRTLRNRPNAHLMIIGVELDLEKYVPTMQTLCGCHGAEGGQFIAACSETASLNDAFSTAASALS